MKRRQHEVVLQLIEAGYLKDFVTYNVSQGETLLGTLRDPGAVIDRLREDPRFANGVFYGLHRDVGNDLIDFRAYSGEIKDSVGSLQLVIDKKTGNAYADIDGYNPYQDVVSTIGHLGELGKHLWRKIKR